MIYFIGGENFYASAQALNELVNEYKEKGFAPQFSDLSEERNSPEIFNSFGNFSMFSSQQVFIIKGLEEAGREIEEKLQEIAAKEQELIFYSRRNIDKRGRFYKNLKAKGKVLEFKNLKGVEIARWIRERIAEKKLRINGPLADELILRAGNDQNILMHELAKLEALQDEGFELTEEVLDNILVDTLAVNVWDFVDKLHSDKAKSFKLLDYILQTASYEQIMGLLARQIRLFYLASIARSREGLIRLGVNPYAAGKIINQTADLSTQRIKKMYRKMVSLEIAVRSSKLDKMLALDLLVVAF